MPDYPPDKPAPCGGWPEVLKLWLGCNQQHHEADAAVLKYNNTTLYDGAPPTSQGSPFDEVLLAGLAADNGDTLNSYAVSDPAEHFDYSSCRAIGPRRVYANKNWHGIFGFTSWQSPRRDWPSTFLGDCTCAGGDTGVQYRPDRDGVKLLKQTCLITYEIVTFDHSGDASGSITRSTEVARLSGFRTFGGSDTGDSSAIDVCKTFIGQQNYDQRVLFEFYCAKNGEFLASPGGGLASEAGSGSHWRRDYTLDGNPWGYLEVNVAAGTLHWEADNGTVSGSETYIFTATTLVWDKRFTVVGNTDETWHSEFELSMPYRDKSADAGENTVNKDCNALLATWNNCDPIQNQSITSGICYGGPLVTRNERPVAVPTLQDDPAATDTSLPYRPSQPDGGIIGAPLPNGYAAYFDFYAYNLAGTYGAWSPFRHATQWWTAETAPYYLAFADTLPPGPFASYAQVIGAGLVKCIWAEPYLYARPPHNFARPCGDDDVAARDPASVDCDTNPNGDARWPNTPCSCDGAFVAITDATNATPIVVTTISAHGHSTGDTVPICGIEGNTAANGTHKLVVTSPTTAELHAVNDDPIAGSGDYTTGGAMRTGTDANFWNSTIRRGTYTFKQWHFDFRKYESSWAMLTFIRNILDVNPDCPVPDNPDPFHYTVNYDEDGRPVSRTDGSGPLYQFDIAQDCIVFDACAPCLILIQSAALSGCSSNAKLIQPAELLNLACDEQYGSLWQGRLDQWMTDPLWLSPGNGYLSLLCAPGYTILEDDGSCHEDTDDPPIKYYPERPFEESLAEIPDGSPDLPAGSIPIGCPDYIANRDADPPVANFSECDPGCFATWAIQLRQEACVAADGRFVAIYIKNGVAKPTDEEFDP